MARRKANKRARHQAKREARGGRQANPPAASTVDVVEFEVRPEPGRRALATLHGDTQPDGSVRTANGMEWSIPQGVRI